MYANIVLHMHLFFSQNNPQLGSLNTAQVPDLLIFSPKFV